MAVRNFFPLPAGQRKAFWVFSCRTPPGCRWRKSSSDKEDRKGRQTALASLSDVQQWVKLPLSIFLTAPGEKPPAPRGPPPWDVTNLHKQRFYHCVSPSLQRCHSNPVTTQTVWLFCHTAHSDVHSACREHRETLSSQCLLSTHSRQLYVQALGPDMQTGQIPSLFPPATTQSLCPASPSLVAVTFHTKVFASLAQRQLENWQLGQASTFSSGISVRVVRTWAWLDVPAHIVLMLVTGTAPNSKYPGS